MASKAETLQLVETHLPDLANPKVRTNKHREVEKKIIEYATNIIKVTGIQGTTITDLKMVGREIGAIVINNNIINIGFLKPAASDTIILEDGMTLSNMDTITILML